MEYAAPIDPRRRIVTVFLFLLSALFLVACLGRGAGNNFVLGHPSHLAAGPARLTCSPDCRDTAQCGVGQNGVNVVLLNSFGPATETHNMAIPEDSPVEIVDVRDEPMVRASTTDQFLLKYYSVVVEGRPAPGWVAGWCVMGTPTQ